jgi:hypothetical protein
MEIKKNDQLEFVDNLIDEYEKRKFTNVRVSGRLLRYLRGKHANVLESYDYTTRKCLGIWVNRKHPGSPPKHDHIEDNEFITITVSVELREYMRKKQLKNESFNDCLLRLFKIKKVNTKDD